MMATAKDTLVALSEKMNFTVTQVDANGDMGKYIDAIEQEIGTGTDGFIFAPRMDVVAREDDLCKEAGLPYISIMTPYLDENGHNLCPTVQFDGVDAGGKLADWVVENYSNYIEGDLSSFGFLVLGFSADQTFIDRSDGFMNRIKEINPELESNIVYVDCIDEGFSIESGYNKAAATHSAHADITN
jgi:ABC-type sugar transport system substrate-binding protein